MTSTKDRLNAFLDYPEIPVASASEGPFAGLSLGVKDIFDVAGYRTGGGNPQRHAEQPVATETAPPIQALLDSGARFVGKTQTDELTFSLMGQNIHYPHPVNPAAPDRVTGGSSSGSAAAVAGKLCDIAAGSDTGGSIRGPASFCGLIGLRTTHGRISLKGAMPLAPSLDTFGWFAKDIETYERVAEVLLGSPSSPLRRGSIGEGGRGGDGDDVPHPSSLPGPAGHPVLKVEGKIRPFRLAALDELVLGDAEAAEYRRMLTLVANVAGAPEPAPALSTSMDDLYWTFRKIQAYEAWAVHGPWISAGDRELDPGVRQRFEFGSTLGCEVATEETKKRNALRGELADRLSEDGLLVLPTMPGAAPLKNFSAEEFLAYRERALRLLCLSGLSGFPQISLPLGRVDGAPFGISLLGPKNSDMALIRLARRILEEEA
ncbi:amidase [Mesorhizobium sp. J18]|uniref:amidase family protein n=1 Tax=Mesorhizobium sp. J18 TaxID=935263 RepID=UPI001199DE30|nr:amidase family protein [Mesorhizobium sp. J18]TWH00131.1 amidase [Mesorhizobium sp. J18]